MWGSIKKIFKKKLSGKESKYDNNDYSHNQDCDIVDALTQISGELTNSALNIKRELHQMTKYFNKMTISYLIISYDGVLIRMNKSFTDLISYNDIECAGNNIVNYLHPNDVKDFSNFISKIKKGKHSEDTDSGELVCRILSKKGNILHIKWGAVNLESDQMIMLLGQDVSHENELSVKLCKYITDRKILLDNYPLSAILTDLNGNIREFSRSAEKQTGYLIEDVVNKKHIFDIFPCKGLFEERSISTIQTTNIKKSDGKLEKSYLLLIPLLSDYGSDVGYLCVFHDEEYHEYIKSI